MEKRGIPAENNRYPRPLCHVMHQQKLVCYFVLRQLLSQRSCFDTARVIL